MAAEKIRESVIAGSWYPGDPRVLAADIKKYLSKASVPEIKGEVMGLIVPHAGFLYSGGVAAHAYKLLSGRSFDRVLIVAPSHRAHFKGASLYNLGGFRTPLGVASLDREIVDALSTRPSISYVPQAHAQEHSLEIQLPFLQVILEDFKLTPIVMGEQSLENCRRLSEAIVETCRGKRVLLIASTDLSHFHSYAEAKALDQVVLHRVESFDPEGLSNDLDQAKCEACGGGPTVTILLAAKALGAKTAEVLNYANSGDITGDHSEVVGYMAAALYGSPE